MVDFYRSEVEMGLNIKKPSTEAAIRELAAQTGESLTEAVESAVREKLERVKAAALPQTGAELLQRLQPLLDEIAAKRIDHRSSEEIMDELYDEHGLPK